MNKTKYKNFTNEKLLNYSIYPQSIKPFTTTFFAPFFLQLNLSVNECEYQED